MRAGPASRARGFTLIELLVALVVFAIMWTLAYGGLASVLNTRAQVSDALQRTAMLQKALFRMQQDLEQVRHRPVRDDFGDTQPYFGLNPATGRLIFTHGGRENPLQLPRSTLQRVGYALEQDELVRYSWTVLDRAQGAQPTRAVLADGIEVLDWRFMDSDRNWRETPELPASAGQPPPLPLAVELTLDTRDWGLIRYVFLVGV